DRAHGLLNRDVRIEARGPIDVDVIQPEAREAVGQKILHGRRPRVDAEPAAIRTAQRAELDRHQGLVPAIPQRAPDQQLVVSGAVEIAGVEQRDAAVERRMDCGDALAFVRGTVHPGHTHAAERQGKHGRTRRAEPAGIPRCRCHRLKLHCLVTNGNCDLMAAADAGHLVIGAAFGLLILNAYRYVWRQAPAVAAIMAIGILARAAAGLALFWISFLDLPILRGLHTGDGFWVFASDARYYYQAAVALADGLAPSPVAPGFINIFSSWMHLVGQSPASGLFLNVALYVLLCVLVVRACRPAGDRTAQRVCAACLGPLSVAPV